MTEVKITIEGKRVNVCHIASGRVWVSNTELKKAGIERIPSLTKNITEVSSGSLCGVKGFFIKIK